MTFDEVTQRAHGNGKTVTITEITSRTAGVMSYIGEVQYEGEAHLNFDQRFDNKRAANRWFRTWSKLAA